MKKIIESQNAPGAVGPYVQAVQAGHFLYISGQLPIDVSTGKFVSDTDVSLQTHQSIKNIRAIVEEAGYELADVIKTTVLLDSIEDFAPMNKVYAEYFGVDTPAPARAAYEVANLPLGALVEIEAIAYKE